MSPTLQPLSAAIGMMPQHQPNNPQRSDTLLDPEVLSETPLSLRQSLSALSGSPTFFAIKGI